MNRTLIDERLALASAQFVRGEYFSAEESRADMKARKAEWLRQSQAFRPIESL